MNAVTPLPMLSAAGWVTSPAEKADGLISHFYLSNKSQSVLYAGKVSSLQWIIEQSGHDMTALVQQLRSELELYLGRYYEAVSAEVSVVEDDELTGKITLRIYCVVNEAGKQYSFGKLLFTKDAKIEKIINLNNNEVEAVNL